jgi:hypothetical protein
MTPAQELEKIIRSYPFHVAITGTIERAQEKAAKGGLEEKFRYGQELQNTFDTYAREGRIDISPEDSARAKKLLLIYFEDLAEQGHVTAMRYAACGYANGDHLRRVFRTATGSRTSARPHYERALDWAKKAEAAGDPIAAKIRPGLEADLKRQQAKNAPKP